MNTEPRPSPLLNEHEAADLLNLSVKTLRQWQFTGRGPGYVKLQAAVRYLPSDLEDFIESGRRGSTAGSPVSAKDFK